MSTPREAYVQRGAAVQAGLRVAEQLEYEARPMPTSSGLRETPITYSRQSRLWQKEFLPRNPLPSNNPMWVEEMKTTDIYRHKSRNADKHVLRVTENAEEIKHIIYMIMETGVHYNWQNPKRIADRGNIEGIGKEVYWKTGVLMGAEEVLRVWTNGRRWVRTGIKKYVMKGLDEHEMEEMFKKERCYPYLRFVRSLFVDYELELRKMKAGQMADEELIKTREDEDDIRFEGVYRSTHQMKFTSIKEERRQNGRSDDVVEGMEVEQPLPDNESGPLHLPPPTAEPSRRRPAPFDAPVEASPNKLRAEVQPPSPANNKPRAPPTPVPAYSQQFRTPLAPPPARQALDGAQEGFASGFSPSGSESPAPDSSNPGEAKPMVFVHHAEVEQPSWPPMVNPLNEEGVYEDGRSQADAISETARLLTNRLMFFLTDTPYQKKLTDMIRIMADTLEQEEKMETPEVLYECMIKHRIAKNNPKTK